MPVSPKKVVVAGRVDSSDAGAGVWVDGDAAVWANAPDEPHASATANSEDRRMVVVFKPYLPRYKQTLAQQQ
jgi:hypothetical protein